MSLNYNNRNKGRDKTKNEQKKVCSLLEMEEIKEWLKQGPSFALIQKLEINIGKQMSRLTSSKLRRFYDNVASLRERIPFIKNVNELMRNIYRIYWLIGYDLGRGEKGDKEALESLYLTVQYAVKTLEELATNEQGFAKDQTHKQQKYVTNFADLMEAIVAFHKKHSSK